VTGPHDDAALFAAQAAYAESIVLSGIRDIEGSMACLERALEVLPTYAPAILTLGSIDHQIGRAEDGRRRFLSLLELPDGTPDLPEVLDKAGSFLIGLRNYRDGLELYRGAVARYPQVAALHQGLGCCAGHESLHELALAASRAALELEPENQELVNDMGWTLYESGEPEQALSFLERAVEMDPDDPLAAENLRICRHDLV
jgi:tetratricopeptide (TPR) repeat protein